MWSATSVDAADEADRVIVVAPLAGWVMGPMGRAAGSSSSVSSPLPDRHPEAASTMIRPDRAIARPRGSTAGALRRRAAPEVHPLAYEQGVRWGEQIQADAAEAPWQQGPAA